MIIFYTQVLLPKGLPQTLYMYMYRICIYLYVYEYFGTMIERMYNI